MRPAARGGLRARGDRRRCAGCPGGHIQAEQHSEQRHPGAHSQELLREQAHASPHRLVRPGQKPPPLPKKLTAPPISTALTYSSKTQQLYSRGWTNVHLSERTLIKTFVVVRRCAPGAQFGACDAPAVRARCGRIRSTACPSHRHLRARSARV